MTDINKILDRLKGQMPQVPHAEQLTDSIMAAIDGVEQKTARTIPMWITLLRTVSSVAAAILIALFIHVEGQSVSATAQYEPSGFNADDAATVLCDDCSPSRIYSLKVEQWKKRKERETLKDKLYASYNY